MKSSHPNAIFIKSCLHILTKGTINVIVINSRIDEITKILHENKKKYEKTVSSEQDLLQYYFGRENEKYME